MAGLGPPPSSEGLSALTSLAAAGGTSPPAPASQAGPSYPRSTNGNGSARQREGSDAPASTSSSSGRSRAGSAGVDAGPSTPSAPSKIASSLSPNHPINLRSQAKATLDHRFSLKSYLGAANTLLEKAEAADRQGQLEQAFVNYIKSANVASFIPKHEEWPKVLATKNPSFHRYQDFMHRVPDIISRTKRIEEQLRIREENSAALEREAAAARQRDADADGAGALDKLGDLAAGAEQQAQQLDAALRESQRQVADASLAMRSASSTPPPDTPRSETPELAQIRTEDDDDGLAARLNALRMGGSGAASLVNAKRMSQAAGPGRDDLAALASTTRREEAAAAVASPKRPLPGLPQGAVASPPLPKHSAAWNTSGLNNEAGRALGPSRQDSASSVHTVSQFASAYPTLDDFERTQPDIDGLPAPSSQVHPVRPLPAPPAAQPPVSSGPEAEGDLPPLPRGGHISVQDLWTLLNPGFATITVEGPPGTGPVTRMIKRRGRRVLLLDVRSREEWETGRIKCDDAVCVEPVSLREDITSEELQEKLILASHAERQAFADRDQFDLVVLYDRNSRTLAASPSAQAVFNAIYQNEFRKILRHQPALLIGGFESWQRNVGEPGVIREREGGAGDAGGAMARPQVRSGDDELRRARRQGVIMPDVASPGAQAGANLQAASFGHLAGPSLPARAYHSPSSNGASLGPPVPPPGAPSLPPQVARPSSMRPGDYFASQPTIPSRETQPLRQSSGTFDYPQLRNGAGPGSGAPQPPPMAASPSGGRGAHARSASVSAMSAANGHSPGAELVRRPGTAARTPGGTSASGGARATSYSVPPPTAPRDVRISLTGLKNVGNSCYMNATLQCLSATVPLARFMLDGSYKKAINRVNPLGTQGALVEAFAQLIRVLWSEQYTFVSPVTFREAIQRFAPSFRGYDQHDAQEFLAFLLDGLHEDLNYVVNRPAPVEMTPAREHELETLPQQITSVKEWAIYRQRNDSLIVDWFQGQFRNKLTCLQCGKTSTTFNPFIFLSLPMPTAARGKAVTLNDCLDAFVKDEVLDKEDRWQCPRCKKAVRALTKLTLSRFPQVLIIHLKRFSTSGGKIASDVLFPTEGLDLTNYAPPPLPPAASKALAKGGAEPIRSRSQVPPYVYDLQAAVHHHGSGLNVGHYMATIRNQDHWVLCDDSRITKTAQPAYLPQSYILFFIRRPNA